MRALYVELMKYSGKNKFEIITPSELPAVLRGNNVVIERFVISHTMFGRDKYRMYLKIGAKAKLPDEVRLSGEKVYDKKLLDLSISIKGGAKPKTFSEEQRVFGKGGKPQQPPIGINTEIKAPFLSINQEVHELLGEALEYNKKDRSLVLEFNDIQSAIRALNILPFGLSYNIKLLDA